MKDKPMPEGDQMEMMVAMMVGKWVGMMVEKMADWLVE